MELERACEHANALAAYVTPNLGDDAISSTFEIRLGPDKDLIRSWFFRKRLISVIQPL